MLSLSLTIRPGKNLEWIKAGFRSFIRGATSRVMRKYASCCVPSQAKFRVRHDRDSTHTHVHPIGDGKGKEPSSVSRDKKKITTARTPTPVAFRGGDLGPSFRSNSQISHSSPGHKNKKKWPCLQSTTTLVGTRKITRASRARGGGLEELEQLGWLAGRGHE